MYVPYVYAYKCTMYMYTVHIVYCIVVGNSLSSFFVLSNLYELIFPMLVLFKNEEIMAQWNKICKYNEPQ